MNPYCLPPSLYSFCALYLCLVKSCASFKEHLTCTSSQLDVISSLYYLSYLYWLLISFLLKCKVPEVFIFLRPLIVVVLHVQALCFRNKYDNPNMMLSIQNLSHKYFGKERKGGRKGYSSSSLCKVKLDVILQTSLIKHWTLDFVRIFCLHVECKFKLKI